MGHITCYIYFVFVFIDCTKFVHAFPAQKATFNTVPTVSMATTKSIAVLQEAPKSLASPSTNAPPAVLVDQVIVVQKTEAPPPTTTKEASLKESETQTNGSESSKSKGPQISPKISVVVHEPLKRSPSSAQNTLRERCKHFTRSRLPVPPFCNVVMTGWS